jgi:hypothetical protein
MDQETRTQLDEHHVERELADAFALVVEIYVELLGYPAAEGLWEVERAFLFEDVRAARKRLTLLRRLARLPDNALDETCEHWTCDAQLDDLDEDLD